MNKRDALNEVDQDTLAKLTLAAVAGVLAAAGGKKLYEKYKENKLLKKYGSQEDKEHQIHLKDTLRGDIPDIADILVTGQRQLIDIKK